MTRRFIAQTSSSTSVKIFDASTGQLFKIIQVGGNITGQPLVSESEMSVAVSSSGKSFLKIFSLPSGGLKSTTSMN